MGTTNNFWQTSRPVVPIDKQRAYITLPAFSSTFVWRGVPTIVLEYQYAATNNFTLTGVLPSKPVDANFTLCIKYRVDSEVFRFKLWSTEGQLTDTPLYNGEVIKKNFTLEVWSRGDDSPVVLSSSTNFHLSIRKVRETLNLGSTYLNADASSPVVQAALVNTNSVPVTEPPSTDRSSWYKSEGIQLDVFNRITQWDNADYVAPLLPAGGNEILTENINGYKAANLLASLNHILSATIVGDLYAAHVFAVIKINEAKTAESNYIKFDGGELLQVVANSDANQLVINDPLEEGLDFSVDTWYLLEVTTNSNDAGRWGLLLNPFSDTTTSKQGDEVNAGTLGTITLGETVQAFSDYSIAEFLTYNEVLSSADRTQVLSYLRDKFRPIQLPLIYTTTQHGISN